MPLGFLPGVCVTRGHKVYLRSGLGSEDTAELVLQHREVVVLTAFPASSATDTQMTLVSLPSQAELIPTCRELGIGIVAYSPLGRGFLTGKITSLDDLADGDWRKANPRFQKEAFDKASMLLFKMHSLHQGLAWRFF